MKLTIALLAGCLMAMAPGGANAASIVKATYIQNGKLVALMVYTGEDGGPNSDPAKYWTLLGDAPDAAYEVAIVADTDGGQIATLKGEIEVSVEIRNKFSMGTAKTKTLKLVRKDGETEGWYLPEDELKRVLAILAGEKATAE